MKAYCGDKLLTDIPDVVVTGDYVVHGNKTYEVISRTYDVESSTIKCILEMINNDHIDIISIMTELFDSPYFETSGMNTNEILNNPRLIMFMVICGVLIEDEYVRDHARSYRDKVVSNWSNRKIPWTEIFADDPPMGDIDINEAKLIIEELLINSKISRSIWPKSIR